MRCLRFILIVIVREKFKGNNVPDKKERDLMLTTNSIPKKEKKKQIILNKRDFYQKLFYIQFFSPCLTTF